LRKALKAINDLPNGAVVIDQYDHAWQKGGDLWYRAFDGAGTSAWEAAQSMGKVRVCEDGSVARMPRFGHPDSVRAEMTQ
jgi:hypothetical protein